MRKLETGIFFVVKTTRLRARNLHGCTRIRGFHFDDPVKILPRPYSQSPRLFPRDFSLFFTTHALSPYRWNDTARTATRAHSFPQHGEIEISMGRGGDGWMRATVLKQTGRNVAAFRRFYSSIDRAALPAPFPCLYRPFPCSPLLSSPFLPFLPPLSVSSLSLLSLRSSRSRSPPRFNAIFLSLSALRATNRRN